MTDLLGFYPPLVRKGIFKGVNLAALARRILKLDALGYDGPAPELRFRTSSRGFNGRGGRHRVTVGLSPDTTIEEAAEVLLHELVHSALHGWRHGHNELFRRRLIATAREAFGLDLDTAALLALPAGAHDGVLVTKGRLRAYRIDDAIMAAMRAANVGAALRADPSFAFSSPPQETPEEVAARRAAAHARRAAMRREHIAAMLAKWDNRAAAAKRLATKWRTKLRRLDRSAMVAPALVMAAKTGTR